MIMEEDDDDCIINLATDNKINKKKMWEVDLIKHLSEIIQSEQYNNDFNKASSTLEAGVKIYSLRVDAVHTGAYKLLGTIHRAGRGDEQENVTKGDHIKGDQKGGVTKEESDMKLSPLSTVESSAEVLNIKMFDAAFTVDPLYHQMSGLFDEGGAKGLLLSNLGVYGHCHVLSDSFEVPEKFMAYKTRNDNSELVDLSFVEECIQQMLIHMPGKNDISPTLRYIVNQFDENNHRPSDNVVDNSHTDFGDNTNDSGQGSFDHNDHSSVIEQDVSVCTDEKIAINQEENDAYTSKGSDIDEEIGKVAGLLCVALGFTSKSNAWAGPDHYRYWKNKGLDRNLVSVSRSETTTNEVKNRKQNLPDICFTQSFDKKTPDIFSPPKNARSLLLPVDRVPCNTNLPEDIHYKPENLVRLFVLPNCMFLGKRGIRSSAELKPDNHSCHPQASWDNENMISYPLNIGNDISDVDDRLNLVRPCQVNDVDIQYQKVTRQFDVHALKKMLWDGIKDSIQMPEMGYAARVSFKQVLHHLTNGYTEAHAKDISAHLFFICLLHLANEHGLIIRDSPRLDELDLHIPFSSLVK